LGDDPAAAGVAGALAGAVGSAAIDRVVDGFVSPQGLRLIFTAGVAPGGPLTDGRFDDVELDVTRHKLSRFTAVVERTGRARVTPATSDSRSDAAPPAVLDASKDGAPPFVLGFVRHGLGWKLAAVKLRTVDVEVDTGWPADGSIASIPEPPAAV
jgi:hypothetical protein